MKKILLLLMIVSVVACGCLSSKNSDSVTATPTDVGRTEPYESDDKKGNLNGQSGIIIPVGVLSAYSSPAANVDGNPPALTDTVNLSAIGISYTMAPINAVFSKPVTLGFDYPATTLPAGISPEMIRVYNYVSGVWTVTSTTPPTLNLNPNKDKTKGQIEYNITITVNDFKNPLYRLVGDIRINKLAVDKIAFGSPTTLNIVFNKELLDDATNYSPDKFTISVGAVAVVPTAAVYNAATKTVTLTIPDQTGAQTKKIKVVVAETLKDKYKQTYKQNSQTDPTQTEIEVDVIVEAVTGLTPTLNGGAGGTEPVVVQANTGTTILSWTAANFNKSPDEMTYVVEIGAAGVTDFSGTLKTYETTTTSVNVSDLEKDTAFDWYNEWNWTAANPLKIYTWRVRAIYKKDTADQVIGANSIASNVQYDRPNELPTVPADPKVNSAVADANTIFIPGGNFSWTASTDPEGLAVTYSIDLDTTLDFTSGSVVSLTAIPTETLTPTVAQLAALTDNTTYYWRVKSVDPRSGESAWSTVSQAFLNRVNDVAVISNLVPTNGGGIPNKDTGLFTADVTNTDRDTYSYQVDIYTDAAGTASVGQKTGATELPIKMTDITWEAGHPIEDAQDYYWKLTVTETTATLPPAGAPVVSALQKFVKSDGDTKPVVTLGQPATPNSGTDFQLGEDTDFTWSATDSDSNIATFTYDVAVFSADLDSSLLFTSTTGINLLTSTIKTIKSAHGLTKDTTYYIGVRANDGADFANDEDRDSAYGDWVRHSFVYKEGPTITDVTFGNVTDQNFVVLWRTDSDATTLNDKLYYTTDGSDPTNASTSVVDASALNKIHFVTVNLGASSAGTTVKFFVESESIVLKGLKTADNNSGSYYEVTMGKGSTLAPAPPASFIYDYTNSVDGSYVVSKLTLTKNSPFGDLVYKTYNFIKPVGQSKSSLETDNTRYETDPLNGAGSFIDAGDLTSMKVIDVVYHSDTEAKTISGEHEITEVGVTFPTAIIDVQ